MQRDIEAGIDGMIGGAAGTATMSVAMLAADRMGLMGEHPPELIVQEALANAGIRSSEQTQNVLSTLLHFGFGLTAGALFAVLHRRLRLPIPDAWHGMVFATLIWIVSYKGWVPSLGVMPPPGADRPRTRPVTMVVSHWIFGATLGTVVGLYPGRKLRRARRRHA